MRFRVGGVLGALRFRVRGVGFRIQGSEGLRFRVVDNRVLLSLGL